jgi:pilus assembly protein CpaB
MFSIKQLTYFTFAIAAAALLVMIYQSGGKPAVNHLKVDNHYVLVAKDLLVVGQTVDLNQLTWQSLSQSEFGAAVGVFEKKNFDQQSLVNRVLARNLLAGDIIHTDDFMSPNDSGYLTTVLAKDKRAVAISVNSQSAIAGLVQPGDWVDVMFYYALERRDDQDAWKVLASSSSRQLVENIRLLAVNRVVVPDNEHEVFTDKSTVTLEVSVSQAQQLYLAQNLGSLSLMLRSKDAVVGELSMSSTGMSDVLNQFGDEEEQSNMVLLKGNVQVMASASAKKKETN